MVNVAGLDDDRLKINIKQISVFENTKKRNGLFQPRVHGNLLSAYLVFNNHGPVTFDRTSDYPFSHKTGGLYSSKISRLDYLKLSALSIYYFFKALFFRRGFSDVVFPFLMGIGAVCLLLYKAYQTMGQAL